MPFKVYTFNATGPAELQNNNLETPTGPRLGWAYGNPTGGYWKVGDLLLDAAGLNLGWICQEEGTPGVWAALASGGGAVPTVIDVEVINNAAPGGNMDINLKNFPGGSGRLNLVAGDDYSPVDPNNWYSEAKLNIRPANGGAGNSIGSFMGYYEAIAGVVTGYVGTQDSNGLGRLGMLFDQALGTMELIAQGQGGPHTGRFHMLTQSIGLPVVAGDPTDPAPVEGDAWYDSTAKKIKFHDGTAVRTVTST